MTSPQAVPHFTESAPPRSPAAVPIPEHPPSMASHALPMRGASQPSETARDLPARIRLLIAQEGGASAMARRCSCSEATVRSWREGQSDLSRMRCITLARALGVSLMWLVSGEGPMRLIDETTEGRMAGICDDNQNSAAPANASGIDPQRLAATLRLLQSYVCMIGGSLDPTQRADIVAELYRLLGAFGSPQSVDDVIAFHARLAVQVRARKAMLI